MNLPPHVAGRIDKHAPGAHWLWKGPPMNNGYGQVSVGSQHWLVHRYVWTIYRGPIRRGWMIDHKCRTPLCCNPRHLRAVPPGTNTLENTVNRRIANGARDRCMRDLHDLTGDNVYVRKNGLRLCRACQRESTRKYAAAHPRKRR